MVTLSPSRLQEIKVSVAQTYEVARKVSGQHVGERVVEMGELLLMVDNLVGGLTDEELPIASHYLYRRIQLSLQRLGL
jgi:hypothetical protein